MEIKPHTLSFLEDLRGERHVCFPEQLRSANRAINKFYAKYLGDCDIGIAQLSILTRLYYFGAISVSRLATLLESDRTTLTRNLQILERSGHISIDNGTDRRQRIASLTDKGLASLEKAVPRWQKAQEALRERLGDQHWDELFEGLRLLARIEDIDELPTKVPGESKR
jgi:DNA-binding MarR family transcriptional regulator